jgi:hypothetical protein
LKPKAVKVRGPKPKALQKPKPEKPPRLEKTPKAVEATDEAVVEPLLPEAAPAQSGNARRDGG